MRAKLDSDGNLQWNQTYGGEGDYYGTYVSSSIALADGYLIVGGASSLGGSQTGLILKTDLQGNLAWNKTYAYSGFPSSINSISEANDGFVFLGSATSNSGAFEGFTWVAKIDSSGQGQEQLGIPMVNHLSYPSSIIQTNDGGHVFVGVWNQSSFGTFNQRFWIVKVSDLQPIASSKPNSFLATSLLQLTIIIMAVTVTAIIAIIAWKRLQHT